MTLLEIGERGRMLLSFQYDIEEGDIYKGLLDEGAVQNSAEQEQVYSTLDCLCRVS